MKKKREGIQQELLNFLRKEDFPKNCRDPSIEEIEQLTLKQIKMLNRRYDQDGRAAR